MNRLTGMKLLRDSLCISMLGAGALLSACSDDNNGGGGSSSGASSSSSSSSSGSSSSSSSGSSSSGSSSSSSSSSSGGVTSSSSSGSGSSSSSSSGSSGSTSSSSGGPTVSVTFQAPVPSTVAPGGNFGLSWTSTGVSSCTASGGSGNAGDTWAGTKATSDVATVTASNQPGVYNYTLTCTGASGTATATATETVSGTSPGIPQFTKAFTATPAATGLASTVHFSWAVTGASSCTAVGGSGTDGWSGSQSLTSATGGVAVVTAALPGTYSYGLFCTGTAGSTAQVATVTVGTPTAAAPSFSTPFAATPSAVPNGAQFAFKWTAGNATSCAATGGAPGTTWTGTEPTSSTGVTVAASSTSGTWTYLLGCNGPGGTTIKLASVTVGGTDCGIASLPTTALLAPHASVTSATGGALCLVCTVSDQQNVIDSDPTTFATIHTDVALLSASESLTVTSDAVFPGGHTAGFIVGVPDQFLTLDLLQNVTVSTYLKGTLQETGSTQASAPLRLDLLNIGLIGTAKSSYLSFDTTKDFDAVQVTNTPLVAVLGQVEVGNACVSTH